MDISKFNVAELFSNDNGKSSGSAFVGIIVSLSGTIGFLLGCFDKMFLSGSIDIVTNSILFVGIGASLLGVRRIYSSKKMNVNSENTDMPIGDGK
jgi:uncharacterized membrane-anchored protein